MVRIVDEVDSTLHACHWCGESVPVYNLNSCGEGRYGSEAIVTYYEIHGFGIRENDFIVRVIRDFRSDTPCIVSVVCKDCLVENGRHELNVRFVRPLFTVRSGQPGDYVARSGKLVVDTRYDADGRHTK